MGFGKNSPGDGKPLDPNASTGDFNFMNYQGAVNLFIDPYNIVVEMSSNLEYIGEVAVKRNLPALICPDTG